MHPELDCLVVGGGPGGLTAGLYLRRYHRRIVLADDGHSRALWIDRSHNVPGFPQGIPGHTLLQRLRQQLADVQGEVTPARVTALVRLPEGGFGAQLGEPPAARRLQARTVLLATGVVDGVPALPGMPELTVRNLLRQCPICDGHEHRGQRIAVIGDGPHAEREARFIGRYSDEVHLVGLAPPPASPPLPGVRRLASAARSVSLTEGGAVQLRLQDGSALIVDVLYAALGAQPRTQLALQLGAALDPQGALVVDAHGRTSVPGLFAAGDVVSGLDQIAVAAGHGAIAATAIHNQLEAEAGHRTEPQPQGLACTPANP